MTPVPSALAEALDRFAAAPDRLVALDFDGVLAPIVAHPRDARPLAAAVAALRTIAAQPGARVALVSGRAVGDAALRLAAPPSALLIGSHGAERAHVRADGEVVADPPDLDPAQTALLATLRTRAADLAARTPGAWVEDKPTAVVVHTRPVAEPAASALEEAVATELGSLDGVRGLRGKRVVELSVAHATKGDALLRLRGRGPVLYAGDDVTDEDALRTLGEGDVGIKVGPGQTCARYRLADPEAVARMLTSLAQRPPGPPSRSR